MNAARRRLEEAKKRNTERLKTQWSEAKRDHNSEFVSGFAVLRQPADALPCSFLIPRNQIATTIQSICTRGLWMRRTSGALNYIPPDNIAVIEIEELANT